MSNSFVSPRLKEVLELAVVDESVDRYVFRSHLLLCSATSHVNLK